MLRLTVFQHKWVSHKYVFVDNICTDTMRILLKLGYKAFHEPNVLFKNIL